MKELRVTFDRILEWDRRYSARGTGISSIICKAGRCSPRELHSCIYTKTLPIEIYQVVDDLARERDSHVYAFSWSACGIWAACVEWGGSKSTHPPTIGFPILGGPEGDELRVDLMSREATRGRRMRWRGEITFSPSNPPSQLISGQSRLACYPRESLTRMGSAFH